MRTTTIRWRAIDPTELPAACDARDWLTCESEPTWVRSQEVSRPGEGIDGTPVVSSRSFAVFCHDHAVIVARDDGLTLDEPEGKVTA